MSKFDILQLNIRDNGCQKHEHICQKQNYCTEIYENIDKVELVKNQPSLRTSSVSTNYTNAMINKIIEQSIYGSINTEVSKSSMHAQWTPLLDTNPCGPDGKYLWDATKSTRWNQDIQREDEHRRFDEMLRYIQSMQQNIKVQNNRTLKEVTTSTPFILPGGIYCRIENEWRGRQNSSFNMNTNTNMNMNANKNRQRNTLK